MRELSPRTLWNSQFFQHEFSQEFVNFTEVDGEKNWQELDWFQVQLKELCIPWLEAGPEIEPHALHPDLAAFQVINMRLMQHFPPRFFRQSEVLFCLMSLIAEQMKICEWVQRLLPSVRSNTKFRQLPADQAYRQYWPFSSCFWLELLRQKILVDQRLFSIFVADVKPAHEVSQKILKHYDLQLMLVERLKQKLSQFKLELSATESSQLPKVHALERLSEYKPILQFAFAPQRVEAVLKMDVELKDRAQAFESRVKELLADSSSEWKRAAADLRVKFYLGEELGPQLDNSVYLLYQEESQRVHWQIPDLMNSLQPIKLQSVTDNDYSVLEVVKQIAYCEAIGYSIGYNNHCHLGHDHPFVMWNFQQGHEEIKHFHAIRVLLTHFGLCTKDLDEAFVAESFREPAAHWFRSPEDAILINFLGEVHNIRAYILLAQCFDEPVFHQVMRQITDDEVVHKKVFAAWFRRECELNPGFERQAYECLLDEGMAMHQAKISPHYRILMQKIGEYYSQSGRNSALHFLNQSMKSQYLELKNLFSENTFRLSEFDFRRRHLKAYVF